MKDRVILNPTRKKEYTLPLVMGGIFLVVLLVGIFFPYAGDSIQVATTLVPIILFLTFGDLVIKSITNHLTVQNGSVFFRYIITPWERTEVKIKELNKVDVQIDKYGYTLAEQNVL